MRGWLRRENVWPVLVLAFMWWKWDSLTVKELAAWAVLLLVYWMARDKGIE